MCFIPRFRYMKFVYSSFRHHSVFSINSLMTKSRPWRSPLVTWCVNSRLNEQPWFGKPKMTHGTAGLWTLIVNILFKTFHARYPVSCAARDIRLRSTPKHPAARGRKTSGPKGKENSGNFKISVLLFVEFAAFKFTAFSLYITSCKPLEIFP